MSTQTAWTHRPTADGHRRVAKRRIAAQQRLLADVPLFSDVSSRQLKRLADLTSTAHFDSGHEIVKEGSPGSVFYVIAEPPDEFQQWLDNEASSAPEAEAGTVARGRDEFLGSSCTGCHAIRGTPARSDVGPDLTHLARRETIAGVLPNTRENLALFITDPQEVKPGAIMPPTEFTNEELDALLDYLESLR